MSIWLAILLIVLALSGGYFWGWDHGTTYGSRSIMGALLAHARNQNMPIPDLQSLIDGLTEMIRTKEANKYSEVLKREGKKKPVHLKY